MTDETRSPERRTEEDFLRVRALTPLFQIASPRVPDAALDNEPVSSETREKAHPVDNLLGHPGARISDLSR